MQPRTITVLIVLGDLKNAFLSLLRDRCRNPALLNIYSFIDICAALANDGKAKNHDIFETYLKEFCTVPWVACSPYDLWAARCSLVHAFSPLGHHTAKPDGAKPSSTILGRTVARSFNVSFNRRAIPNSSYLTSITSSTSLSMRLTRCIGGLRPMRYLNRDFCRMQSTFSSILRLSSWRPNFCSCRWKRIVQ